MSVEEAVAFQWMLVTVSLPTGLYRGSQATVLRDAPFSGLYYMFYTKSKQVVSARSSYHELTPIHNFACGIFAGMLASVITQPADVIKTHQQVEQTHMRGTLEVMRSVVARNGLQGLFAGTTLRVVRRSCMAAFTWTFYEEIVKILSKVGSS